MRVGIVDDSEPIRRLLRLSFETDDRFLVVAEGSNGQEAIALVSDTGPDLLLLDQQMPVLNGIDALPEIRRRAPATTVVLYTGDIGPDTSGRALAAGAAAVLPKQASPSIVDQVAEILLKHLTGPVAEVELTLGPMDSTAARTWVRNTSTILEAVRAHPEVIGDPVPDEVLDVFGRLLETWREVADQSSQFYWSAKVEPNEIQRLIEWWARIDRMTDEQLAALNVHWSPPQGEPFFRALTAAVLQALSTHHHLQSLRDDLIAQWGDS